MMSGVPIFKSGPLFFVTSDSFYNYDIPPTTAQEPETDSLSEGHNSEESNSESDD